MKLSNWRKNKAAAVFNNKEPTLTDQAAAKDTDLNVIVDQFLVHGQAPGAAKDPIYGDFSGMPNNLRDAIETSRKAAYHKSRLPKELQSLSIDELLALTPEDIRKRLTPPEPPAEPTKEEPK